MISATTQKGNKGEKIVKDYLEHYGFSFVQNNYRSKYGEIDAIFKDKGDIVFVETKTRKMGSKISGVECVNYAKKQRIIKTAWVYCQDTNMDMQPRFDVAEVLMDNNDIPKKIRYIKNAFDAEDNHASF